MTTDTKKRRTALLCKSFVQNLAYCRARRESANNTGIEFLIIAHNNFLEMCVLEWCKIFADRKAKHFWKKVVDKPEEFYSDLLKALKINEPDFDDYNQKMRAYRDQFVAHLDDMNSGYIPDMEIALKSVAHLYSEILATSQNTADFPDIFFAYETYLKNGIKFYKELVS